MFSIIKALRHNFRNGRMCLKKIYSRNQTSINVILIYSFIFVMRRLYNENKNYKFETLQLHVGQEGRSVSRCEQYRYMQQPPTCLRIRLRRPIDSA